MCCIWISNIKCYCPISFTYSYIISARPSKSQPHAFTLPCFFLLLLTLQMRKHTSLKVWHRSKLKTSGLILKLRSFALSSSAVYKCISETRAHPNSLGRASAFLLTTPLKSYSLMVRQFDISVGLPPKTPPMIGQWSIIN